MDRITSGLRAVAWLCLVILCGSLNWGAFRIIPEVVRLLDDTKATAREIRGTAQIINTYVLNQSSMLQSPKNQKAIEAAIQTVAIYNSTGRLLNTQVMPRVMRVLDEAHATTASLQTVSVSLNELVRNTDRSLNRDLFPTLNATAEALRVDLVTLDAAIAELSSKGVLTLDDIHKIMADPAWAEALKSVAESSKHIETTTSSIDEAAKRAPLIADSLQQIAGTSSKYRKAILLVQLLSVMTRTFLLF